MVIASDMAERGGWGCGVSLVEGRLRGREGEGDGTGEVKISSSLVPPPPSKFHSRPFAVSLHIFIFPDPSISYLSI